MKIYQKAFAKHTPSVFVLESPFQLLCAIEAIHEFEINDAKFVFSIERNSSRNRQLFNMAKQYGIVGYDIYYEHEYELDYFDKKHKKLLKHREDGHYERIFIGDEYNKYYYLLALHYAAENAVYVGMDDGTNSIIFMRNIDAIPKPHNWRKRLNWYRNNYLKQREQVLSLLEEEHVYDAGCMFTVYNEVKSQYSIYPNTLSHVAAISQKGDKEGVVLIVGTVLTVYAENVGLPEILIESILWQKLFEVRIKYPSQKIVYVPHGRDTNEHIPQFCDLLNISYLRIEEVIETYMLNSPMYPAVVYGFDSSALVHLKKLYPNANVYSWRFRYNYQENNTITKAVAEYYTKIGIQEETIWVHKKNFTNTSSLIKNIKSLFLLVVDKLTGQKHN